MKIQKCGICGQVYSYLHLCPPDPEIIKAIDNLFKQNKRLLDAIRESDRRGVSDKAFFAPIFGWIEKELGEPPCLK